MFTCNLLARRALFVSPSFTAPTRLAVTNRCISIGVPTEQKRDEFRVGLTPSGVKMLVNDGHQVVVEKGAGVGSGISDQQYVQQGAKIASTKDTWDQDLVVKVKEPLPSEFDLINDQIVFTYFHMAADRKLTESLLNKKAVCIAYETVQSPSGVTPLLLPMSEVAGRMSVQEGAKYLEAPFNGRGKLLSGVPGVAPGRVLIIGGGVVGQNAGYVAAGLGAIVTILDSNVQRLRYLSEIFPNNVETVFSTPLTLEAGLRNADVVIGAVYIPGEAAPKLIQRTDLAKFKPRAVFVDVSVDQGGIAETTKATSHTDPTFIVDGINHYCVGNIPGAVPATSTFALNNVTLPYVLALANKGWKNAVKSDSTLMHGVNIVHDTITHKGVAKTWSNLPYSNIESFL